MTMPLALFFRLFSGSIRVLGRVNVHVPSALPHTELVRVTLEYGLILIREDRVVTDGDVGNLELESIF